jgi:biopolymer transport protein ExbD
MAERKQAATNGIVHYEPQRQARKKERTAVVMQPPMTPMIDVVFQLLLFFLIACRFVEDEGQIRANLPDISGPQTSLVLQIDPINVLLHAFGKEGGGVMFSIRGKSVNWTTPEELFRYLDGMRQKGDPEKQAVIIKPAGPVRWMHVVDAFNQAVRAQFKQIGLEASGGAGQAPEPG